jgi:hypothetical protein
MTARGAYPNIELGSLDSVPSLMDEPVLCSELTYETKTIKHKRGGGKTIMVAQGLKVE